MSFISVLWMLFVLFLLIFTGYFTIVIAPANLAYLIFGLGGVRTGKVVRRFGLKWPWETVQKRDIRTVMVKVRDRMLTKGGKSSVDVSFDIPVIPDTECLDKYDSIAEVDRIESLLAGASSVVRVGIAVVTVEEAQEDDQAVEAFISAMFVLSDTYGGKRNARENFEYVRDHLEEVQAKIREQTAFGIGRVFSNRAPGRIKSKFEVANAVEALGAIMLDFDPDTVVVEAIQSAARVEARERTVAVFNRVAKSVQRTIKGLSGAQVASATERLLGLDPSTQTVEVKTGKGGGLNIVDIGGRK